MNTIEIMKQRHSVRQYIETKIEKEKRAELNQLTERINLECGMHI